MADESIDNYDSSPSPSPPSPPPRKKRKTNSTTRRWTDTEVKSILWNVSDREYYKRDKREIALEIGRMN